MEELSKMNQINNLAFDIMHKEMNPTEQFVYADKIYQLSLLPELNENQQVVLEWLKSQGKRSPIMTIADFADAYFEGSADVPLEIFSSYDQLSDSETYQVLAAFAEWGMKEVAE